MHTNKLLLYPNSVYIAPSDVTPKSSVCHNCVHQPISCNTQVTHTHARTHVHTHTHTRTHTQPFNGPLPGTNRASWHQKKHSSTHTHEEEEEGFVQTTRSALSQWGICGWCKNLSTHSVPWRLQATTICIGQTTELVSEMAARFKHWKMLCSFLW